MLEAARAVFGEIGCWSFTDELRTKLEQHPYPFYAFFAFVLKDSGLEKINMPNFMLGRYIHGRYAEHLKTLTDLARLNANLDYECFLVEMDTGRDAYDILQDDLLALTPLYRYLVAKAMGLYHVAEYWEGLAVRQLRENPHYYDTYQEMHDFYPASAEGVLHGQG